MPLEEGILYVVPTPVGNLEDLTLRALRVLSEADLVLAEDTRVTRFLLQKHQIETPVRAYHQFNERASCEGVLAEMRAGKRIALVSDAGTPGISDPGQILIAYCLDHGWKVSCLPGANALLPALVMSGFDTSSFVFHGFLPHKKGRQTALRGMAEEHRTQVLYESPHRLLKLLSELCVYLVPERRVAVVREISKMFEEVRRGSPAELEAYFQQKGVKGEIAVVIEALDLKALKRAGRAIENTEEET